MLTFVFRYMRFLLLTIVVAAVFSSASAQEKKLVKPLRMMKKYTYEEVDFEDMIRRYFMKETSHHAEGIYSVSCVITKTSKVFLSSREKTKIVERHDNYARVAIVKDFVGSKRDFIEVSLSYRDAKKYPVVGVLNSLSDGPGFVYHHTEPDGKVITISMFSESPDLMEGEYSRMQRRKTITYKLSYLKIYPKSETVVDSN
jgi:hypothetical protein